MPYALLLLTALSDSTGTYSGIQQQLRVPLPRLEAGLKVDGVLDDPVWPRAARLTDFSQYSPADGRPAEERTEVLVWYSPTAIHFGARVYAQPGTVRAHLADRDRGIIPDDYIEIQLGTFNDRQQAFVFGVNPLGVQADGALVEGNQRRSGPGESSNTGGREQADLSPDYTFDSKGRLTDFGYEIEIRIPFKSLKYQSAERQDWSLQIIRKSAASGREDTWAPARRAASSFLAQAGTLVGLTRLQRGLVLELNPIATSSVGGLPQETGGWDYTGGRPEFGGNIKWGLTTNLTLNGTVNPDFSQVESDAGQVTPDPRRALFFPEKRPFFLDGLEYFSTPSQVIYTRRIAAPLAAAKITGKVSGTSFGFLSAVDGAEASTSGLDHPVYNLVRVQRDLGGHSRLGLAYADKIDGGDFNRVGEVDGRLVFGGIYNVSFHGAVSRTRRGETAPTAPTWFANFSRNGRVFGFQANFQAISDRFRAESGFISQGDIAQASISPSITLYGTRGALLQRFTGTLSGTWTWAYTKFVSGAPSLDRQYWLTTSWTLRGGWTVGSTTFLESFGYDERLFRDYAIEVPVAGGVDTVPYGKGRGQRLPSHSVMLRAKSPELAGFSLDGFAAWGKDVNYLEWSAAEVLFSRLGLAFRPTEKLRFESSLPLLIHYRWSDRTRVDGTIIPRLKVEYQLSRAVFLRLVGEYRSQYRDDLRDESRSNYPVLIRDPEDGVYKREPAVSRESYSFRVDWLFSYQPTPGTVFFAGYGSSLSEDEAFRFRGLRRFRDGFFTKFSYLLKI